ncbi:MAG: hypothetical protein CVV49_11595 [Spirochaetae bacterium HGW-Spirochaetae-5]|nr:MAG: hypothetical protein CVV49_11595 [Spirochaetae bacterium HGW-Spirochaetae-5]
MKKISYLFCMFVFVGCSTMSANIVEPRADIFINQKYKNSTLFIIIDDRVKNDFLSKSSGGIKDIQINGFRESLSNGLLYSFSSNVREVVFVESQEKEGLYLIIRFAYPRIYKYKSNLIQTKDDDQYDKPEVKCKLEYVAELSLNGKLIKSVNKEVVSEGSIFTIFETDALLRDVIEVMFREIGKDLFI